MPFLGLILQWNVEERKRGREREAGVGSPNGGNKKDADGPHAQSTVDSTFAERALVNSEIAKVK